MPYKEFVFQEEMVRIHISQRLAAPARVLPIRKLVGCVWSLKNRFKGKSSEWGSRRWSLDTSTSDDSSVSNLCKLSIPLNHCIVSDMPWSGKAKASITTDCCTLVNLTWTPSSLVNTASLIVCAPIQNVISRANGVMDGWF
jgi:hypothetical protein